LREDYPAVDVTTVVFSRDFAGVGCCVIPQDRVLAIIAAQEAMAKSLADALAAFEDIKRLCAGCDDDMLNFIGKVAEAVLEDTPPPFHHVGCPADERGEK